jgi:hypothetical protein
MQRKFLENISITAAFTLVDNPNKGSKPQNKSFSKVFTGTYHSSYYSACGGSQQAEIFNELEREG